MYTPLQFIEQIHHYIKVVNGEEFEEELNNNALAWFDKRCESEEYRKKFVEDFVKSRDRLSRGQRWHKSIREYWDNERLSFRNALGSLVYDENDHDFHTECMQMFINSNWRFHKLTYKVEPYMVKQFYAMEAPDLVAYEKFSKVPAECYYIDLSGCGDEICQGLEGMFAISSFTDSGHSICLVCLIRGGVERLMPIFSQVHANFHGSNDFRELVMHTKEANKNLIIKMEDGIERKFNESLLWNFYTNFVIYLHTANRDVESEGSSAEKDNKEDFKESKKVTKKKEPKNKYKEIREYKLGYRLVSERKKIMQKSIGKDGVKIGTGRTVRSHFRSGHYHHYWVGHGEEKKLIVKFVDGVYVNGKNEQDVAVVHKVKGNS